MEVISCTVNVLAWEALDDLRDYDRAMDQDNATRSVLLMPSIQVDRISSVVHDILLVVLVEGLQRIAKNDSSRLFGVEA